MKTLLPNPAILSLEVSAPLKSVLTSCFVHQASCDYGRIKNACQSKLHLSLVSILKAARGYEGEFQACGDRLLHAAERSPDK